MDHGKSSHTWRSHPWNTDFEWQDHTGPLRRVTPAQVRDYDEKGFFVLEDAIDPALLDYIIRAIDPFEAQVEGFLRTQENGRLFIARADEITFSVHLVLRSELLRELCRSPLFSDLCHDLIGPDARLYWDQAVYKKPGTETLFPWHQDNGYTFLYPQEYLTCWVALTEANLENGCPWVIPGVHRRGTLAHRLTDLGFTCAESDEPTGAQAVPVPAGGIAVFSSLTPHATGPNRTNEVRKSYIVQFAPEGSRVVSETPGGRREEIPANDPERQFPVLVDGLRPD